MPRAKKKETASSESKIKEVPKKKTAVKKTAKKSVAKKESVKENVKEIANENNTVKPAPKESVKTNAKLNSYLVIDYPVENDVVRSSGYYAIRIGASHDGYVELSFNGGEWIPCRYSDGYWWFDWVYFAAGDYTISARMIGPDAKTVIETEPRKCKVC
ncbi:MAG: hypothetical protein LBQ47_01740 [Endomicrobium sp.]|jgi:hypothetical protein|nr:hypothetical protein [Endomicrobium sp.]